MTLNKLLRSLENLILLILKKSIYLFSGELNITKSKGENILNSQEAYNLYHDDLLPKISKARMPIPESLWTFILVISFLKFVL